MIRKYLEGSVKALSATTGLSRVVERLGEDIITALARGHKVVIFGNGGSAADAQHFATELTCRFEKERKPLAALALTTDTSALTAIANDYSFAHVFSRQVKALMRPGDIAIGISTSGKSLNVLNALCSAEGLGARSYLLTGKACPKWDAVKRIIRVPAKRTSHIQECHIAIIHALSAYIDKYFVNEP